MIIEGRQLIVFPFALLCFVGLWCSSAMALDSDALEDVSPLDLVEGQGEKTHRPGLADEGEVRVYWFWSSQSSCSRRAEPAILSLTQRFPDVEVVVVMSNVNESVDEARKVLEDTDLGAPVYRDRQAELAIALEATMTPEVVVVDDSGVVYRGRPVRMKRRGMDSYVEDVVDSWKAGREVERQSRRPTGCPIRRP